MSDIQHGTYAGYQRCKRRPEKACQSCKDANAEYKQAWRQKNLEGRKYELEYASIQAKAFRILRDRHRSEFDEIINGLKNDSS